MESLNYLHFAVWGSVVASVVAVITVAVLVFKGGRWVGMVEENKKRFDAFVGKAEEDLKEIREDIKKILMQLPPSSVTRSSPLHLTDLGERISDDLQPVNGQPNPLVHCTIGLKENNPTKFRSSALIMSKEGMSQTPT